MRVSSFINQFRQVKEKSGLKNREIAKALGVSEQTVGSLLLGVAKTVSDSTAEKITRWLALNGEKIEGHPGLASAGVAEEHAAYSAQEQGMTVDRAARYLGTQFGIDTNEVLMAVLEAAKKKKKGGV